MQKHMKKSQLPSSTQDWTLLRPYIFPSPSSGQNSDLSHLSQLYLVGWAPCCHHPRGCQGSAHPKTPENLPPKAGARGGNVALAWLTARSLRGAGKAVKSARLLGPQKSMSHRCTQSHAQIDTVRPSFMPQRSTDKGTLHVGFGIDTAFSPIYRNIYIGTTLCYCKAFVRHSHPGQNKLLRKSLSFLGL